MIAYLRKYYIIITPNDKQISAKKLHFGRRGANGVIQEGFKIFVEK